MTEFPPGFLWGAATAAHQVEGGNSANDWWQWEHTLGSGCVEPSGDACDHYHRYPEDLSLLAGLGFKAYRFSVEWSRIQPEADVWSNAAVDHYVRVCEACHANGLTPMVTFHHFTTPRWVAHRGGWEDPDTPALFAEFCARTVERLGDLIGWAATLNEPNVVAMMGYQAGVFPPGRRDPQMRREVTDVLLDGHRQAGAALRAGPGSFPVGVTLSMTDFVAVDGGEDRVARYQRSGEDLWLEAARHDDFFGVQTYTRMLVGPDGPRGNEPGVPTTQMGYEDWPAALEACIRRAARVIGPDVPLVVTESGISTDDDQRRVGFVQEALGGVLDCVADGIDVRGYVYWSLLDNFEWAFGYGPKFGLIAVDRATQERTVKESARWLGAVARGNRLLPTGLFGTISGVNLDQVVDRVFGAIPGIGPWYDTPEGRKKVRYALVSVVAVPVGEAAVLIFNLAGLSAVFAALLGNSCGAVPSYILNRYWVWGKTDKNNLLTEILPFWIVTLIGILFSLYTAHVAGQYTKHHHIGGAERLVILLVANLAAFGILWVAKYLLFNKVLFVVRHEGEAAGPR